MSALKSIWTNDISIPDAHSNSNNTTEMEDHIKYSISKIYTLITPWEQTVIIGNGLIARAFVWLASDKKILVFASGVSNSNEENPLLFNQERQLLIDAVNNFPNRTVIYFGSCSIYDPSLSHKPYVKHKKDMEILLSEIAPSYHVFRLPLVVGKSDNPNTLTNYLYLNIINGISFNVWKHAKRYLIDVDDIYDIVEQIIKNNFTENEAIDIAFNQYSVIDIIQMLEKITHKKALYTIVDKGVPYPIDTSKIESLLPDIRPICDETYLEKILQKYYL